MVYLCSCWPSFTYGASLAGITLHILFLLSVLLGQLLREGCLYSLGLLGFHEDQHHQISHVGPLRTIVTHCIEVLHHTSHC